jgi:nucleotide-binding universal stress UspA family protein
VVQERHPVDALVELSSEAELLVVRARGRGGFHGLVLGSVTHALVLHATCPVVVVPSRP